MFGVGADIGLPFLLIRLAKIRVPIDGRMTSGG